MTDSAADSVRPLQEVVDEATADQLRKALTAARGSVTVAAQTLGVSADTVYRLMRKHGVEIQRVIA